jgi:glycosyltransferase involved in cell wall biosynthesis
MLLEFAISPPSDRKMRVAFILDSQMWLGGRNYFRNLLIALSHLPNPKIDPIIFLGKSDASIISGISVNEVVRTKMVDRGSVPWFGRKIIAKAFGGDDWLLQQLMMRHKIDAISHSGALVRNSHIPSVAWIPDFQHVRLPEFFTAEEHENRNRGFMQLCKRADRIILSSHCALSDLQSFAPVLAHKGRVLNFVASPLGDGQTPALEELHKKYGIGNSYFIVPNQFWAHKNHRVIIEALAMLKQRNRIVTVIATGSTIDDRNPEFFQSLMNTAERLGVTDQFRVLGVIPFNDLAGLMKHSIALINPSLFEGWSTSVEEAKSAGKRVVLSDIPVHREQAPVRAVFFPPDEAGHLAQVLWDTLLETDPEIESEAREEASKQWPERQRVFAQTYQDILLSLQR